MTNQKILIVDDEPSMRTFLSTLLETNGYEPIVATTGLEGMKKARGGMPRLIILDVMLSEMSGIRMYRKLKTDDTLKHIPVIMLSAVTKKAFFQSDSMLKYKLKYSDGRRTKMWTCPWDHSLPEPEAYVEKPPEPEDLLKMIQEILK